MPPDIFHSEPTGRRLRKSDRLGDAGHRANAASEPFARAEAGGDPVMSNATADRVGRSSSRACGVPAADLGLIDRFCRLDERATWASWGTSIDTNLVKRQNVRLT